MCKFIFVSITHRPLQVASPLAATSHFFFSPATPVAPLNLSMAFIAISIARIVATLIHPHSFAYFPLLESMSS